MSFHESLGTPCPVQYGSDAFLTNHENESTFNFTSAFQTSLKSAKPRRPRGSVVFAIHDDNPDQDGNPAVERRATSNSARQIGKRQAPIPEDQPMNMAGSRDQMISTIHPLRTSRLSQAPKRPTNRLATLSESSTSRDEGIKIEKASPKPLRQARRGTLYIPTEDTTMPSMYMGIFSPIKNFGSQVEQQDGSRSPMDMTGIAAQMAMKRGDRKSIMRAAPRRAPLQPPTRPVQESAASTDRYGQGGGKENVPPGLEEREKSMLDLKLGDMKEAVVERKVSPQRSVRTGPQLSSRSSAFAPTASSLQRANLQTSTRASPIQPPLSLNHFKPTQSGGNRRRLSQPVLTTANRERKLVSNSCLDIDSKSRVPSRFVVPTVKSVPLLDNHALLPENIVKPDMYEDNWLSHQEVAITQLVNSLFDSSEVRSTSLDQTGTLRQQSLAAYSADDILLMYKRLRAALLYGPLSVPQEILDNGDGLWKDLGRRQHFLDLWLQTYDHVALEVALEVVVGRQCRPVKARTSSNSLTSQPISKKVLQSYIEAFLLRNEDGNPSKDTTNRAAWSYQRTTHRSLMLIKVLDLMKTNPSISMPSCLFHSSSMSKSSIAVVRSLFRMLNTSASDPVRALNHLDYHVSHVQLPLEEFDYKIENLAVDLRDGTRLTRLVELLLYPSASQILDATYDPEATTTVVMPEGESLDFQNGSHWPLSQHLRFPCQARAPMLWNVQVALSAIHNVKGMTILTEGVTAEDIVDGYREKTIRLLWALVGKWGLPSLLDWKDLEWETRRLHLQQANYQPLQSHDGDDMDDGDNEPSHLLSFSTCKSLLKQWTRAIASSHMVPLQNFTTSFADGKIFEAIVNEYEPFIPRSHSTTSSKPHGSKTALPSRLSNLGCSSQFSQLFTSQQKQHIFSSDFVLAALAFLAARLLPPSKAARAATVIQRRWRAYWARMVKRRRETMREVAGQCISVVNGRNSKVQQEQKGVVHGEVISVKEAWSDGVMSPESVGGSDIWLSL